MSDVLMPPIVAHDVVGVQFQRLITDISEITAVFSHIFQIDGRREPSLIHHHDRHPGFK
jgi:hypothetical protein